MFRNLNEMSMAKRVLARRVYQKAMPRTIEINKPGDEQSINLMDQFDIMGQEQMIRYLTFD